MLTIPLFLASSAIYPIAMMPTWLQVASDANPLTYQVDALRGLMLAQPGNTRSLGLDVAVLVGTTALLVVTTGRLYPQLGM